MYTFVIIIHIQKQIIFCIINKWGRKETLMHGQNRPEVVPIGHYGNFVIKHYVINTFLIRTVNLGIQLQVSITNWPFVPQCYH